MSNYTVSVEETETIKKDEPRVAFLVMLDGQEVYRSDARVFNEDDMIAASNEIVGGFNGNKADIDQIIAGLIEPIRIRWLRDRNTTGQQGTADQSAGQQAPAFPRYEVVASSEDGSGGAGIRDVVNNRVLSNFVLVLDKDIAILDDMENQRVFKGTLTINGRESEFRITAEDYADNSKLKASIFKAGGPEVQINSSLDVLRTAISAISEVERSEITTNFGWNGSPGSSGGISYLVPSGRITASGFEARNENGLQVELGDEELARYLDMRSLDSDEVMRIKRHLVADLLPLHERRVTYTMLAASACSVLQQFAPGAGRFAIWMTGLTGAGKSFLAKLFMNFFGDFPVSSGRFTTWSGGRYRHYRDGNTGLRWSDVRSDVPKEESRAIVGVAESALGR